MKKQKLQASSWILLHCIRNNFLKHVVFGLWRILKIAKRNPILEYYYYVLWLPLPEYGCLYLQCWYMIINMVRPFCNLAENWKNEQNSLNFEKKIFFIPNIKIFTFFHHKNDAGKKNVWQQKWSQNLANLYWSPYRSFLNNF